VRAGMPENRPAVEELKDRDRRDVQKRPPPSPQERLTPFGTPKLQRNRLGNPSGRCAITIAKTVKNRIAFTVLECTMQRNIWQ
jgi:hypothetical protein